MRHIAAIAAIAALISLPAHALPPPTQSELIEQRRVMDIYIGRGMAPTEIPELMRLWFGRQFRIVREHDGQRLLYVYQGIGTELWDYHYVGTLPKGDL